MNIGIDIDDTINNLHEMIIKHGTEFNKKYNIDFEINPNEWDWYKSFGWTEKNAEDFLKEYIEDAYENVSIKEKAIDTINKLHEEGNNIIIITSRSKKHCKDPFGISKKWLNKNNIKFDKLIVDSIDKGKTCIENNIDIFIDDHIGFCEGVSNENIKVLMFDSPYNQKETRYKRVYNWDEVYSEITKI